MGPASLAASLTEASWASTDDFAFSFSHRQGPCLIRHHHHTRKRGNKGGQGPVFLPGTEFHDHSLFLLPSHVVFRWLFFPAWDRQMDRERGGFRKSCGVGEERMKGGVGSRRTFSSGRGKEWNRFPPAALLLSESTKSSPLSCPPR